MGITAIRALGGMTLTLSLGCMSDGDSRSTAGEDPSVGGSTSADPETSSGAGAESSSSTGDAAEDGSSTGEPQGPGFECPDPAAAAPDASIASVYCYVLQNDVSSISELMAALPKHVRDSYTLMSESRSLHTATVEAPRVILYGTDTRFIFSVSTEPSDPRYQVVELAELVEETGAWRFRAIDFTDPAQVEFSENQAACAPCHGDPARPIWGRYPDWPGAYGAIENKLEPGEIELLDALRADPSLLDGRLAALEMPDAFLMESADLFHLTSRDYGYANTAFNFELGVSVADGMVTRLRARADWEDIKRDLVRARFCTEQPHLEVPVLYQAYGFEDVRDFYLDEPVTVEARESGQFDWNQGNTGLSDIIVFRVLDALVADGDPAIIAALASIEETRARWIYYLFELRGEERSAYLSGEYDGDGDGEPDGYDYADVDLRPQELIPPVAAELCAAL